MIKFTLFWATMLYLFLNPLWAQITVGTLSNNSNAADGYFLLAPNSINEAYLLDNCGYEVHKWTLSTRPGLSTYLLEDGRLLRTGKRNNPIFNQGGVGGLVEIYDWDNTLLWSYEVSDSFQSQHHDVELLPNGNVLVLATERIEQAACLQNGRDPNKLIDGELWPEMILEIEPIGIDSGRIVWEWHSWDHLIQDYDSSKSNFGSIQQHPGKFNLNYTQLANGKSDWQHCNSIDYNPHNDQIMLSSRNFSEIWIIDHSTTSAEAASSVGGNMNKGGDILFRWGNPETMKLQGPQTLFNQHDARWIASENPDSGKIMVFNNGGDLGYSTVDILIPPTTSSGAYLSGNQYYDSVQVVWSFVDTANFFGKRTSGAHQLPNGNVFICEGPSGRVFEVDSQKNVVFEYINPISSGSPLTQGSSPVTYNGLFRASKYLPDYPAFSGKILTTGLPIELNPNTAHCQLYTDNKPIEKQTSNLVLFPNPTTGILHIYNKSGSSPEQLIIYNSMGKRVLVSDKKQSSFQLNFLPKGVYFVTDGIHLIGQFTKL